LNRCIVAPRGPQSMQRIGNFAGAVRLRNEATALGQVLFPDIHKAGNRDGRELMFLDGARVRCRFST